ncbi:SMI1/KNR4 family protein [Dactylosporangium sp. NPDC049742]|uniref:SMI1/KNR4 family protein n=1 Tax=Dactylosporangium sp. NPDC049742 TaxID=3154737 RepID=UPI0034302C31
MMADGGTALGMVLAWLDRSMPGAVSQLRPPARNEDLRAVETAVGRSLPGDLASWWRAMDGVDGTLSLIPPHHSPYSTRAALENREILLDGWNAAVGHDDPERFDALVADAEQEPAGSACRFAWLPSWLPIAGDRGGDYVFADLRPGPANGCLRLFYRDAGASDVVVWPGVAAMVAEIATGVTFDLPVAGCLPWIEAPGTLTWYVPRFRWYRGGSAFVNGPMLQERYGEFVAELRQGGFSPPARGWSAGLIAAHVARNTELLSEVANALVGMPGAAADLRYDNTAAFDPVVLNSYASLGTAALADRIASLSSNLRAATDGLDRSSPRIQIRLVEGTDVLVDGPESLSGVLNALWGRQLPLRIRQLRALRADRLP